MGFISNLFGANPQEQLQQNVNVTPEQVSLDPATLAKQNAFVNQLQAMSNGTGPSAATTMLSNQASQNAAAMASQAAASRGINPALAQRNAAEANVQANQNTGQSAALARAHEQLGATSALGSTLSGMQDQSLAYQKANQGADLTAKLGSAQLNTGLAQGAANANAGVAGGLLGAIGPVASLLAKGGVVKMADGGGILPLSYSGPAATTGDDLSDGIASITPQKKKKPKSEAGQTLAGGPSDAGGITDTSGAMSTGPESIMSEIPAAMMAAKGGIVPAKVSPGEVYLPPEKVKEVATKRRNPLKAGEKIPGKPKVGGAVNSYANDTVDKNLKEGGVVIPRSVTMSPDAVNKAKAFLDAVLAHHNMKAPKK